MRAKEKTNKQTDRLGETNIADPLQTDRRKHSRDQKCDEWRNNGGKKGVVCQAVPAELLLADEPKLTVARRQGKIRREGLPELRYQQFNVSSDERPLAKSGPIILYHVLPNRMHETWTTVRPTGQGGQVDAPRWQALSGLDVAVEASLGLEVIDALKAKGHAIKVETPDSTNFGFGGAQLIAKTEAGYVAGSDPRKDGCAVGY